MTEQAEKLKAIVFELETKEYAVPVELVGSIERMQHITRVPKTKDFVKGVINLRGVVTPILDLRKRFKMNEEAYTDSTRIIILHLENFDVGFIVDAAYDVIDIDNEAIEPAPKVIGTVDADYIDGVAKIDKRLIMLLNLDKVLQSEGVEINN
ncbi:chemotaxis protein CheW [Saliterribacillus persicus]|uniref:Chemotaxis protein CheW n=1 Tax=Saliterribacillus persicus TaxID=930114 RepID=A0A368XS52_9BACI|nr:chemotaxis protein CheW [Saliterribacillus persicus]RCW70695.1 purine-binding chemotaxis protein CheW [Saliterribacillus persicus]